MSGANEALFPLTLEQDAKANEKCRKMLEKSAKDPHIKFMFQAMNRSGCTLSPEHFVCQTCPPEAEMCGGFDGNKALIRLCSNRITEMPQRFFNIALSHELVHAYDHCRAEVNWSNVEHQACSEIRACMLSRECYYKYQKKRKEPYGQGDLESCIKPRTVKSLMYNGVTESEAIRATHKVFAHCVDDTAPFDRVPS
ncbi:mitochondrial inner membrane protease ATP23 homolog [Sycon ciliatum]|uniref:mitochondrial inner membrane protease ATP23 homolog n=1 Tax=Sycon ciliatum TaxID=27933 RepID=UPI0020AB7853|eukprot:scpid75127/ scgid16331/ Mitochondrial inner membrane protease ATP23 homolog